MDQHQQHASEQHYAGLDVSLDETAVCVLDAKGAVLWRGKCTSTPEAIRDALRKYAPALVRVGLETGQISNWLTHGLRRLGVPVVCLDARHAKAVLKMQVNKTDANDALGLAQIVRTGWYREVAVKGMDAQTLRLLLVARAQLVSQRQTLANAIRGLLKTFGHRLARGSEACSPGACARRPRATTRCWPSWNPCCSPGRPYASGPRSSTAKSSPAPRPTRPRGA